MLGKYFIEHKKATNKEQWISLYDGSSCYLVIAKHPLDSKRFVGKTRFIGKQIKVPLGSWEKDFNDPQDVLDIWRDIKRWSKVTKQDPRTYLERNLYNQSSKTVKEVFELFIKHKSRNLAEESKKTLINRLNRILSRLPDGILIDGFSGNEGTQFIKIRVCDPSVASGNPYTAKRYRRLLNQVFNFALKDRLIHPENLPFRLDLPFNFEENISSQSHPHVSDWNEFKGVIEKINSNPVGAGRLTDLAVKASLLMMTRVSVVVSMKWEYFNAENKVWEIPADTKGLKRKAKDLKIEGNREKLKHYIPHTPQIEVLMNNLHAINGNQEYIFASPYKGNNTYLSAQTPNDHLINLGFQGKQDAHGFRHVFSNTLIEKFDIDERKISRTMGHLLKEGNAIDHYVDTKRLDEKRQIMELWNSLLITDGGLRI